ncbi:DNA-3-methyladenine glycosylase I [Streptococcus pneumoniae]|nr:DNA-3-methyladenine glycosylase I [Streptococcus pneumoniae]
MHLTNKEILDKILSYSEDLKHHYQIYQLLLFHFQNKDPEKLAKDLKKRGFKFTGPVAVLSFLQAAGLVDDHENDCEWKGLK